MSEPAAPSPSRAVDPPPTVLFQLAGVLLVLAATVLVAVVESFYTPLRLGTVRVPLSVGLAVVCHPFLIWWMRRVTRNVLAMIGPFVVWLAVVLPLGASRAESDLIITGKNWVATTMLYGGALLFVGSIALLLPARPRSNRVISTGSLGGNGSA